MTGLWVPGELVPTNRALSDQRAAGWHEGFKAAMVRQRLWRPGAKVGEDRYAGEAAGVRRRVALVARAAGLRPLGRDARVRLRFVVQGYSRWDASGGMLAAKWAEDGLVAAGVIPSDRFNVREVTVSVVHAPALIDPPRGLYVQIGDGE